jgi:hypothetical protein
MTKKHLVYDEDVTVPYGLWVCPECGSRFYGGGRTIHEQGCSKPLAGYESLEFHFGPLHVDMVVKSAEEFGPDFTWYGISLNDIQKTFPELLKENET